jgi:hypothetical protein
MDRNSRACGDTSMSIEIKNAETLEDLGNYYNQWHEEFMSQNFGEIL